MTENAAPENIDAYIAAFPSDVQAILERVRRMIVETVPDAVEKISYRMPAFTLGGRMLIYFAAFQKHLGIFPPVQGSPALQKRLQKYQGPKGNLKFPYDQPMPYALIKSVIQARIAETSARNAKRSPGKRRPKDAK